MPKLNNYKFILSSIFVLTLLLSTDLFAQSTFAGQTMQLNGNAALADAGATLRLTSNGNGQTGTAFIVEPFYLSGGTSFSTFIQFRIYGGTGADGLAFVIHNDGDESRIGSSGGGMGYAGIDNSLIVEIDTWDNGGSDPNENHVGVNLNGSTTSLSTFTPATDFEDTSSFYLWVDYNGRNNELKVYLDTTATKPGSPVISETIALEQVIGSPAYVGFTAATGAANNNHDIEAWTLNWQAADKIPTLSEWSRIMMILLLAGIALIAISRSKTSTNA